jgi:hypothetical protein
MSTRNKLDENEMKDNPNGNGSDDDTFGLPDVDYKPLDRSEPQQPEREKQPESERASSYQENVFRPDASGYQQDSGYKSTYTQMEEEDRSVWPKLIGVLFLVLIAGVIVWYFAMYKPKQAELAEKAKREQLAREEAEKRRSEQKRIADVRKAEAEQRRLDSLARLSTNPGNIQQLTERTGKYYVVVSSAIDNDLLMDYANKLIAKGENCFIIPPFGNTKFHRLAIDSKDTYGDAQARADGLKSDYTDDLWVIKY